MGLYFFWGGGGDLTGFFSVLILGRLIFGGAYTWRGLFSEFYGIYLSERECSHLIVFPHNVHILGTASVLKFVQKIRKV